MKKLAIVYLLLVSLALPTAFSLAELREVNASIFLHPVEDGYIAGGYQLDGAISPMKEQNMIAFFDKAMNEQWRISDERLIGNLYDFMTETPDGFIFYGNFSRQGQGNGIPSIMKVTPDGQIAWQYKGHKYASSGIGGAYQLEDGSILFTAVYDPEKGTPKDAKDYASITKLTKDGAVEWTRGYQDLGFTGFWSMERFGNGFLLCGTRANADGNNDLETVTLLYIDAAAEPKAYCTIRATEEENSNTFATLLPTPQGMYLYGNITVYEYIEISDQNSYMETSDAWGFYADITEEMFEQ